MPRHHKLVERVLYPKDYPHQNPKNHALHPYYVTNLLKEEMMKERLVDYDLEILDWQGKM
jgi:hypothetical protein